MHYIVFQQLYRNITSLQYYEELGDGAVLEIFVEGRYLASLVGINAIHPSRDAESDTTFWVVLCSSSPLTVSGLMPPRVGSQPREGDNGDECVFALVF